MGNGGVYGTLPKRVVNGLIRAFAPLATRQGQATFALICVNA